MYDGLRGMICICVLDITYKARKKMKKKKKTAEPNLHICNTQNIRIRWGIEQDEGFAKIVM